MTDKTEYEIGYINGFYGALKGTQFIASLDDATVEEIRQGIQDVFDMMVIDGDMAYIRTGIDDFIEAAEIAESTGRGDEFLEALEDMLDNRDKGSN